MTPDEVIKLISASKAVGVACHKTARGAGWWDDRDWDDVPTLLLLAISELTEAMEGHRKSLDDPHLPHRGNFEVELADAIIRIYDMASGFGLDVHGAIAEKLVYNAQRADHKAEARGGVNGKKY